MPIVHLPRRAPRIFGPGRPSSSCPGPSVAWSGRGSCATLASRAWTLAEVDTAPCVCRKTSPDGATIWGVVTGLGLGALPSTETERVREMLEPLFPGVTLYPDVMACGLSAVNPVVHPAGVLMNAGRVEYSRGEFYFYEEGVSPSVADVIMRVDRERRDIGTALSYELLPANEAFHRAGFGPKGDLWATINGSLMLTRLKAPGSLESRWLTEDIPYGLATWSLLGAQYGVETPLMRAMVDIGSVVMGFDGWTAGRGIEDLGIAGMDRERLKTLLRVGTFWVACARWNKAAAPFVITVERFEDRPGRSPRVKILSRAAVAAVHHDPRGGRGGVFERPGSRPGPDGDAHRDASRRRDARPDRGAHGNGDAHARQGSPTWSWSRFPRRSTAWRSTSPSRSRLSTSCRSCPV